MLEDWLIKTMYATKRRRRTVKSVKSPNKEPPKSNPSKRHRERLNGELDHLASLLPFEQSVISKLDKLSILRLAVSYLRTKSFFQSVLPARYGMESHLMSRSHLFHEPGFSEGESILQALYGFLFVVTCEGEVFFASRTVEQYLGFHQSDIIHQSVMELIHSEDRDEFKRQLTWSSMLPSEKSGLDLHDVMLPDNSIHLHRSFTVRFRCLLDNTSGFITLEINGWIRILHGQGARCEDPQLALFATCSPFGPLSLFDIPSREMTFKTKHKMDFSPVTMDNRGKNLFAYTDQELSCKSGYDLIHPDDLNYFSLAHQELIKTGSSGLISYRWQSKHFHWLWLQSSCKVIYKNSKPDFIICTHRQLTEDEGQDLFGKRGNEFKLPYPLLDIDMCTGFGFADDDVTAKVKTNKSKKKSNSGNHGNTTNNVASVSGTVSKECQNGKKRKAACIIGGIPPYCSYTSGFPAYDGGGTDMKAAEPLYPYTGNTFGFDTDVYRGQTYPTLTPSVYPGTEPYRLEMDKHGYFLDHRQYQHSSIPYSNNTYNDYIPQSKYGYDMAKYGYDVPKYGFDSYSLDLSKRVECADISHLHSDVRRYALDYHQHHHPSYPHLDPHGLHSSDRLAASRLNVAGLEAVDLRNPTSLFTSNSYMNTVEGPGVAPSPCVPPSPCAGPTSLKAANVFTHQLVTKEHTSSKVPKLGPSLESPSARFEGATSVSLPHNSVIKSTRQQDLVPSNQDLSSSLPRTLSSSIPQSLASSVSDNLSLSIPQANNGNTISMSESPNLKSPWNSCSKSSTCLNDSVTSNRVEEVPKCGQGSGSLPGIGSGLEGQCDPSKSQEDQIRVQSTEVPVTMVTGIPVSVVKQPSSWLHSNNNNNNSDPSNSNININNNSSLTSNNSGVFLADRDWVGASMTGSVMGPLGASPISHAEFYTKSPRLLFSDPCHSAKHIGLKVYERGDNPLLSFSEMTHTLMSSTH